MRQPIEMSDQGIIAALEQGQFIEIEIFKTWMKEKNLSDEIKHTIFVAAAVNGHLQMVQYLKTLPGIDPTAQDNLAIRLAAEYGHLNVVQCLIALPGVDPTVLNNYAIRYAAENGHLNVVQYLMTLPGAGVDPTVLNNDAIRWAAQKGRLDVVQYLMTLPGVDPTALKNLAIRWAWQYKQLEVVALLVTHPKVQAQEGMENTLQATINAIKLYHTTSIRHYQFFKSPEFFKDVKQHIVQVGSTNLQKNFPAGVDSGRIIKAILQLKNIEYIEHIQIDEDNPTHSDHNKSIEI